MSDGDGFTGTRGSPLVRALLVGAAAAVLGAAGLDLATVAWCDATAVTCDGFCPAAYGFPLPYVRGGVNTWSWFVVPHRLALAWACYAAPVFAGLWWAAPWDWPRWRQGILAFAVLGALGWVGPVSLLEASAMITFRSELLHDGLRPVAVVGWTRDQRGPCYGPAPASD